MAYPYDSDSEHSSMAQSRASSPDRTQPKRKRRVEWHLPDHDGDEEEDGGGIHAHWAEAETEPRDISEETRLELKRSISQMFEHGSQEQRHDMEASCDDSEAAVQPRRAATMIDSPRPKPALKRGESGNISPDPELVTETPEEYKSRAATDAQERAHHIAQTLSNEDVPLPLPKHSKRGDRRQQFLHDGHSLKSGQTTPTDLEIDQDYVPKPKKYRLGNLSALQALGKTESYFSYPSSRRSSFDEEAAPGSSSGTSTPNGGHRKPKRPAWHSPRQSHSSLSQLVHSAQIGAMGMTTAQRPQLPKSLSSTTLDEVPKKLFKYLRNRPNPQDEQIRIKNHIQENNTRQGYLLKLCRALMIFGAPTHRLEEYMRMSARVLEIEAQFLYIPGCMIVAFDDSQTRTTEVKLVRVAQGIDLGKLREVHEVYKQVVHDLMGAAEATERLDRIIKRKPKFKLWFLVVCYGLATVCVGPFAFGARPIDLPIAFLLGCLLGLMQLILAPQSDLYTSVFEIIAVIATSFLSRAFGSIAGGKVFCFSALAQSSIALILPGYTVLCGALELQSKNIVSGSVRLVYAIIYALFIGFALTIGTALYGWMDGNATSETTCSAPSYLPSYWFFPFVPFFALFLSIINQAKWQQMPVMVIIAFAAWVVNYFSSVRFAGNSQISSTFGALVISVMANVYARVGMRPVQFKRFAWKNIKRTVKKISTGQIGSTSKQSSATSSGASTPHPEPSSEKPKSNDDHPSRSHSRPIRALLKAYHSLTLSILIACFWVRDSIESRSARESINEQQALDAAEPHPHSSKTPTFSFQDASPLPSGASTPASHGGPSPPPEYTSNPAGASSNIDVEARAARPRPLSKPSSLSSRAREHKERQKSKGRRANYSLAAAAMLPAIFVQVPSGLSVSGSLVSGLSSANQIVHNSTGNGTISAQQVTSSLGGDSVSTNSIALTVGYSVVQVAIGITVGLFCGTIVVYPFGKGGRLGGKKMRSGLFSF